MTTAMRRVVMAVALSICVLSGCRATPSETAGQKRASEPPARGDDLESRPLYAFTEDEVDVYLRAARDRVPELRERVVHLGRRNIGQPYEIYLLGEFPYELYDTDPLYCLDRSDCLVFAEHMYAMALSRDWWAFLRSLQRIRYRHGVIGMLTRNHYTIADWNRNNAFLFEDVSTRLGAGRVHVPLKQVCRRAQFFAKFGIGQDIPDEPVTDAYIPKDRIPAIADELRDGDFVNIIRGNEESQYCGHTGLIAIGDGGTVNFLHSSWPVVDEERLVDFVSDDKHCLGIKILRLRPNAQAIMDGELNSPSQATEVSAAAFEAALAKSPLMSTGAPEGYSQDWMRAMRMQSYRLDHDTPTDRALQTALEAIDQKIGGELGIPPDMRAFGVLDLTDLRLALVRPDALFYGASVPKICIVLAYFAKYPDAVTSLDPLIEHELQLVIKRSDNDLAARYSQLVGIEAIQELLLSRRYRFYDREHGGGIWCGKHYGIDEPRTGDPVGDHSHAATVRQCLRYYLLLEQGKLVNAAVSAKLKQIFAAPDLEFHNDGFVRGLNGRDVAILRKNGLWEDWHLDTARVQHGERLYLLAGMTRHPRGNEYLQQMAAAVDELCCGRRPPAPYVHELIQHESVGELECLPGETSTHESPVVEPGIRFNEVLLSWNVATPPGTGFCVEMRVGRRVDDTWSPWLHVGEWADAPPDTARQTQFDHGRIDVDYFRSDERFDRLQYRVLAASVTGQSQTLRIDRVAMCVSDLTGIPPALPRSPACPPDSATAARRRLPVPFRSQITDRPELAGRICNPTSVAMVLAYRGVERPTGEVADACYDEKHEIYGSWPRSIQAAYAFRVPGYLTRFSDWAEVEQMIANDQPLVISIRLREGDRLRGAPYRTTEGHLMVLAGFDESGDVHVNDPALTMPEEGCYTVPREDLETAWMRNTGGVTYVLLPCE